MREFELIERLTRALPLNDSVVAGAGDDCAVLDLGLPGEWLLLKTDAVVEGIHFEKETSPEKIGRKALARNLSDIAAMAGQPTAALVTLGIPPEHDVARLEAIYGGLSELARQHGVAVVGGETTTSPERLFLSVALLGRVARDRCLRRTGARAGDALFVTGQLGGSRAGKHLDFEPRLAEARWLAAHFPIHSMIDLSDGLAGDLRHLLTSGNIGAELLASAIPISRAARLQAASESSQKSPLLCALTDGEDFELLFTAPGSQAVPLLDAWKQQFPSLPLGCIGKITDQPGVVIRDRHGRRPLEAHGYAHFA